MPAKKTSKSVSPIAGVDLPTDSVIPYSRAPERPTCQLEALDASLTVCLPREADGAGFCLREVSTSTRCAPSTPRSHRGRVSVAAQTVCDSIPILNANRETYLSARE